MKIRGKILVLLLSLSFFTVFVAGCAGTSEVKKPVPIVVEKPEPVIKEVIKKVSVHRSVGVMEVFVIDGYPIDVSDIQVETQDDLNRLVQKLRSLGPDSVRLIAVAGSCSEEGTRDYNLKLGYRRADKVKKALLDFFPKAEIVTSSRGERSSRRQVQVFYGASRASILEKVFIEKKGKLIFCDSVTFKINHMVIITVDLTQNDFKLRPGEIVRVHSMTRNNDRDHTDDVVAVGEFIGDGKIIFRFLRFTDIDYIDRFWFTTSEDRWPKNFRSRFLVRDGKGNLAVQVKIRSDSVESISADQFLDQPTRYGKKPSDVYTEKKKVYFKKED